MPDKIADHILKRIWYELCGVYEPGSLAGSASVTLAADPRILIRHPDGTVVELTARTLPAGDPAAARIEESIRAIEAGEVE